MLPNVTNAPSGTSSLIELQGVENTVSSSPAVPAVPSPELVSAGPAAFTRSQQNKRHAPPSLPFSLVATNGAPPTNSANNSSRPGGSSEFPQSRTIEQLLTHIPNVTFVAALDEFASSKLEKPAHTWVPTSGHLIFDEESRQPICEFLVDSVYYGKACVKRILFCFWEFLLNDF